MRKLKDIAENFSPAFSSVKVAVYALISFLALLPYMIVFYPGIVEVDTSFQLAMSMGYGYGTIENYDSPFPIFDIRLLGALYALGEAIGHNAENGIYAICLFQCTGVAFSISLMSCYLSKWSVPPVARLCVFAFFALMPIVSLVAVDIGKDTIFLIFFCPFAVCFTELMRRCFENSQHNQKHLNKQEISWGVATVISGALSFLVVSKGLVIVLFCLGTVIVFAIRHHNRSALNISAGAAGVLCLIYVFFSVAALPVMSQGLPESSSTLRESLGTPIQQATWVAKVSGDITDKEREQLNRFYDLDAAVAGHLRDTSDPAKVFVHRDVDIKDALWFMDAYVSIGITHPKEYLKSFIDLYDGFWQMGTTESLMLPRFMPNYENGEPPQDWENNTFRFPGDIDELKSAINNDQVVYGHGNLPEYKEAHPDFGDWLMPDDTFDKRASLLCFIASWGQVPVMGALVSKSLYVLYLTLALLLASAIAPKKGKRTYTVLLLAPLGLSCVFAFLSPADLARYVYPCLMLVPFYVALIGTLAAANVCERLSAQRKKY